MRNELEQMEHIENYLLDKMDPTEKTAFENEMQADPTLKAAVENQQLLVSGLQRMALKESIRSSGKKYFLKKMLFKLGLGIAGVLAALALALFLSGDEPKALKPFINPPIPGINMPYTEYMVDPAKGLDTTFPSGSSIHIPKNAFVDENGKPITHLIRLKYREFRDPAEIFIAGIPMAYDSADVQYHFESAGMFEILGYDGDKPVAIDPANPIRVELASLSSENRFSQYYLDTVKRSWDFICTEEPYTRDQLRTDSLLRTIPLVPVASDPSKYRISIEADTVEFPELGVYKGVKFEVSDETRDFNPKWSNTIWDKAILTRMDESKYMVTFERGKEKHEIITYPVLDSVDREKAIREFQLKTLQYNSLLKEKENSELGQQENMEQQLKILDSTREVQDKRFALDQININKNNNRNEFRQTMSRVFSVNRFGIYNSDCPMHLPRGVRVEAKFIDDDNGPIYFDNVTLVVKGINALYIYDAKAFYMFGYSREGRNMIWAVTSDNKLAVCSEAEFVKAKTEGRVQIFKMHIFNEKPANEQEAKKMLGF